MNPHEHIDAYLLDRLDEADKQAFEAALASDAQLKEAVVLRQEIRAGISAHGRDQMLAHFQQLEKSFAFAIPGWAYTLAAAVAVIFLAVWLWPTTEPTPDTLFAEHFSPHPNYVTGGTRGEQDSLTLSDSLFRAYDAQRWGTFLPLSDKFLQQNPNDAQVLFYKGVSLLAMKDYEKAESCFDRVLQSDLVDYHRAAGWYRALSLIGQKDLKEASSILEQLVEGEDKVAKDAQELLEKLEEMKKSQE